MSKEEPHHQTKVCIMECNNGTHIETLAQTINLEDRFVDDRIDLLLITPQHDTDIYKFDYTDVANWVDSLDKKAVMFEEKHPKYHGRSFNPRCYKNNHKRNR